MPAVDKISAIIQNYLDWNPEKASKIINYSLAAELFRVKHFSSYKLPQAFKFLNKFADESILKSFKEPENTCFVNLFAPVEILQCFDYNCLSIETISAFLSGFKIENYLIDRANEMNLSSSLCSFHRCVLDALDYKIIKKPSFSLTTSTICDANVNTFRYFNKNYDIPTFMLDVPRTYTKEGELYLVEQLKDLIKILEKKRHIKFDNDKLKTIIMRENQSHEYYKKFLEYQKDRYFPNTLTLLMFTLFASHLSIGSTNSLKYYKLLYENIKEAPIFDGKKILWVHVLPYYEQTLKSYFNLSEDYQIQCIDMNSDYLNYLDENQPLNALAKKMIYNLYNSTYDNKAAYCTQLVKSIESDGVIHFAHYGCKQTSGGVRILKKYLSNENIPLLLLDGDSIDRRNTSQGQTKTRIEAFLEMLN